MYLVIKYSVLQIVFLSAYSQGAKITAHNWFFEGDISGLDAEAVKSTSNLEDYAQDIKNPEGSSRWIDRRIPYVISSKYSKFIIEFLPLPEGKSGIICVCIDYYDDDSVRIITEAIQGFDKTCLRFVSRTNEDDFLLIEPGSGEARCHSNVGKLGGKQLVIISTPGCLEKGTIQHELMHAVGFFHEQSRLDRDDFVDINFKNIAPENQAYFQKYTSPAEGQPYDFGSVMHYEKFDFALSPDKWTVRPKPRFGKRKIGQRDGLSELDVIKINVMYNCSAPSWSKPKMPEVIINPDSVDPVFEIPHRGCYYTANYEMPAATKFTAADVDPSLCTFINMGFGKIQKSNLKLHHHIPNFTDIFTSLNAYKSNYPNLKLILSVGGYREIKWFSEAIADQTQRDVFVTSVVRQLRLWKLDGFNVDWFWTSLTRQDKDRISALLAELRSAFELESAHTGQQRLTLTTSFSWSPSHYGIPGRFFNQALDIAMMNADMSCDCPGQTFHHSPLKKGPLGENSHHNMASFMEQWHASGISRSKLIAGVPMHGRAWILTEADENYLGAPTTGTAPSHFYAYVNGTWPFYEICQRITDEDAESIFDPSIKAAYAYTDTWWVGYDDQQTVTEKVKWVKRHKFGGVFTFYLGQDDFQNSCGIEKNPLLSSIRDAFVED